jgi:hypothetical protein
VEAPAGPRWLRALESSVEIVDVVFASFTNTLSFVRIAAFAAVHASIFFALFAIADTVAQVRFGGPLSVLTIVAGNAVIILLEGLTISVQVLRLEYYEFFTRFFRGGGDPYRPLSLGSQAKGSRHAEPTRSHRGSHDRPRPGGAGPPGGAVDAGAGAT